MGRKSTNQCSRPFLTNHELKTTSWGTTTENLGTEAHLPFGYCHLSLKPPVNPVATPEGVIYDKEYILESLMQQKKDAQETLAKFEAQQKKKADSAALEEAEKEAAILDAFKREELGQHASASSSSKQADKLSKHYMQGPKRTGNLTIDKAEARKNNFWVVENTPEAAAREVTKPDMTTKCPMTGKKLRMKDLVAIKFVVTDEEAMAKGGDKGMYCCSLSKKEISHQKCVLLKPSGHVILESMVKDCVKKTMTCPISGAKLKESDIIQLRCGGTGFAKHNSTQASKYVVLPGRAAEGATKGLPRLRFSGSKF